MEYEGCLDFAGCTLVAGWARCVNQPDVPVEVDIVIDGKLFTAVKADQFRQDLLDAGKGDGRSAFSLQLGPRWRDGKPHLVEARISGTEYMLTSIPWEIIGPEDISEPMPRHVMDHVARMAIQPRKRGANAPPTQVPPMKIHIVCYEDVDDWILGKIARRLAESLRAMGMAVQIGKQPDPAADINHHIIYWGYVDRKTTVETVMVTHIDNYRELGKVRQQLVDLDVEMGICMSFEGVHRLAHFGVPRQKLCFVSPAHDDVIKPRKIVVGITSRVYPDGCKREYLVKELSARIPPDQFKFSIMGSGWEEVVRALEARGIEVDYTDHFDYEAYCKLIPGLDYYLYPGLDEGSMGFIDAVAAAVPTIVAPQGYHLDAPAGITHPFRDLDDLAQVFSDISAQRTARTQSVSSWTWAEYARKHALVWHYLLCRKRGQAISKALDDELCELGVVSALGFHGPATSRLADS
jgi:hypothetical protein